MNQVFLLGVCCGFVLGGFIGVILASAMAATRMAELRDAKDLETAEKNRLQRHLWTMQTRAQRMYGGPRLAK